MMQLIHGECLVEMDKLIADNFTFHAIITDIPYGTTACAWDSVIPFNEMWSRLNQLIKPNGAICLFGSEPFSSYLRLSNIDNYKYDWKWIKERGTGFAFSNKQPMRKCEDILVFYDKQVYYDSIGEKLKTPYSHILPIYGKEASHGNLNNIDDNGNRIYKEFTHTRKHNILEFKRDKNSDKVHPTQKPVALIEYLIKTYTQEGEIVLDFTAGSFTTAIACINTNRQFIGIELDEKYYNIGIERVKTYNGLFN